MTRAVAVSLLLVAGLTGCGAAVPPEEALRPAASGSPAAQDCRPAAGDAMSTHVDHVPFVRLGGLEYVRSGPPAGPVPAGLVGAQVGSVTCTLSDLAFDPDRRPRDGDAGFLPVGTPLHALEGAAPGVRLLAREDGAWHVYDVEDDTAARRGGDLLDLRGVVRVSLVEADRGEDVVQSVTDPDRVAALVDAVGSAALNDRSAQSNAVRGPQWFVRFDLASGPPVQRAWYPEGRWLFPRIDSPQALHDALLP
jgi:hypothetical protein